MLTPEEQAELAQLRQQFAPKQAAQKSGLTPEEQAELASLRNQFGGERQPGQSLSDLPKDAGTVNEQVPQAAQPQRSFGQEVLDRAQTQLESFGNAVSLGYLPQLQAAHEKLMGDPNSAIDADLRAKGFTVEESPSYVQMRDQNIKRQHEQASRNPYDSAAGALSGMAVTTPIMASGQAALNGTKAVMGGFQRLKDSARIGATLGLVSNPGDTEGVMAPVQAMNRLQNSGTSGALGAVTQFAGDRVASVGEAVKKAPAMLEKIGNITAVKAIGALPRDLKKLFGNNNAHEIGDTLIKKGIVSAGDSIEEMAKKSEIAKRETGTIIGDTYRKMEDIISNAIANNKLTRADKLRLKASELDGQKIVASVSGIIKKTGSSKLGGSKIVNSVQEKLDDLAARQNLTVKDLLEFKSGIDADINYSKQMKDLPEVQQQLKHFRDVLNKKIQDRVRVAGKIVNDEGLITTLKQANKEYGHLSKATEIATNRAKEIEGHKWLSLSENLAGGTGATIGAMTGDSPEERFKNAMIGFAAGAGMKKADKFLTPAVANSAKRLSVVMKKPANFAKYAGPLIEAAKRSPEEFQALVNQFGKDPEFIKLVRPAAR